MLDVGSSEQEVLGGVGMLRGRAEEEWVQAQEETAVHTMRGTRWAEREGELQAHHCLGKGQELGGRHW